jgi:hypothetical protein
MRFVDRGTDRSHRRAWTGCSSELQEGGREEEKREHENRGESQQRKVESKGRQPLVVLVSRFEEPNNQNSVPLSPSSLPACVLRLTYRWRERRDRHRTRSSHLRVVHLALVPSSLRLSRLRGVVRSGHRLIAELRPTGREARGAREEREIHHATHQVRSAARDVRGGGHRRRRPKHDLSTERRRRKHRTSEERDVR